MPVCVITTVLLAESFLEQSCHNWPVYCAMMHAADSAALLSSETTVCSQRLIKGRQADTQADRQTDSQPASLPASCKVL